MASHKVFEEEVRAQEDSNQEHQETQEQGQPQDGDQDMESSIIEE